MELPPVPPALPVVSEPPELSPDELLPQELLPVAVTVDSYAAPDTEPLDFGEKIAGTYGFVDRVSIGGAHPAPLASRSLTNDDVLVVSGWAGHQKLGMSMPRVLFALCGRIVGSVTVGDLRPDVAQAVHPYLDQSGWRGQLAVAHLPRCEEQKLQAFGLGPQGRNLWPLAEYTTLMLPPLDAVAAKRFVARAPPLTFAAIPIPKASNIIVKASALRLRACGASDCEILGKVTKGTYPGYVIERRGDWALVQLPALSGWLLEIHLAVDG